MSGGRLTVVHFTRSRRRGGAEEHMLSLARALDPDRFAPVIVCAPELAVRISADVGENVRLVSVPLCGPRDLGSVPRLSLLFRRLGADVVHSHLFSSSLVASSAARVAGVRAVIETPHVAEGWRSGWRAHFFADRLLAHAVDAFIAVSHANARYLTEVKRLPARKVRVIRNGISPERFARPAVPPGELRRALGFGPRDPVLAVVARIEPQKGHAILLEALALVRESLPAVRLAIVGEGSLRGAIEERARALRLGGSVRFVGHQTRVADWLALADVVVLPSFYEGLPLAALEALAAERAVVATAVDGTPEAIRDGETGLTVPPGDPSSLAWAILRLVRDPELARRLAREGRRTVEREFTIERQARETQLLYQEVFCRSAAPRAVRAAAASAANARLEGERP